MMLRSRRALVPVVLMTLVLPGCSDTMRARASPAEPAPTVAPAAAAELKALGYVGGQARSQGAPATGKTASTGSAAAPGLSSIFASLKLIRTAQISVEVAQYEQAAQEVTRVAESLGGYLAEAKATRGEHDRRAGSLTIRVPSDRFGEALAALKGLGTVKSENVSTQDVTKAYADLETRLKVKRDTADRLRELLRTRTADLPDVLNAERELARVTEEIEQMEGERRFYDQQVAFSTIALSLFEPQALVEAGLFSPLGHALRDSVSVLVQSLAGLLYVLVALAPWLIAGYLFWRVARALRARKKTANAQA